MKHLTVAFEVNDGKKFKRTLDRLRKLMVFEEGLPYRVTALSIDNEFNRIELIEQVIASQNLDYYDKVHLIEEILSLHGDNLYEKGSNKIFQWEEEYT